MDSTITVALLSCAGTILGSLFGVIAAKPAILYGTIMTKLLNMHTGDGDVQPKDVKLHGYKYIRKAMAMTQAEFAEEIGVSRGSLSNYETGKTDMPVTASIKLWSH